MPRRPTKVLAINNNSGESRVFPSLQTCADYIFGEGFAGSATNSSITSFITRISKEGGTAYGFTVLRCPPEALENPRWSETIAAAAKTRAICQMVVENALNPDAADIICNLKESLEEARDIVAEAVGV